MTLEQLTHYTAANSAVLTVTGLTVAAVIVAVSFLLARRRGRTQKWLATTANLATLALSAEGMWMVATQRLGLPAWLAVGVFFVAEAMLVSEALLARQHYRRTGRPGPHGAAVWVIAAVSGVIVATNANSLTEVLLRLALPLAVAGLWWAGIAADQPHEAEPTRRVGRWRWTPRRALIRLGALTVEDDDVEQINREHHLRTMTALARKIHHDPRPGRHTARYRLRRLERLALRADDAMLAEVQRRVRRAARVADLTHPDRPSGGRAMLARPDTIDATTSADTSVSDATELSVSAEPDITRDMNAADSADTNPTPTAALSPDTSPMIPATPPPLTVTDGRTRRSAATRAAIAELSATRPDLTHRDIARQVGVSERTVTRHLRALELASANGHHDHVASTPR